MCLSLFVMHDDYDAVLNDDRLVGYYVIQLGSCGHDPGADDDDDESGEEK